MTKWSLERLEITMFSGMLSRTDDRYKQEQTPGTLTPSGGGSADVGGATSPKGGGTTFGGSGEQSSWPSGIISRIAKIGIGLLAGGAGAGSAGAASGAAAGAGEASGAAAGAGASGTAATTAATAPSAATVAAPAVQTPSSGGFLGSAWRAGKDLAQQYGQEYRDQFGRIAKGFNPFDASNISNEVKEFGEAIDAIRELKDIIRGPSGRQRGSSGGPLGEAGFKDVGASAGGSTLQQFSRETLSDNEGQKKSEMMGSSVELNVGDILSKPYMRY